MEICRPPSEFATKGDQGVAGVVTPAPPVEKPGWLGQALAAVGALVSAIYLANVGAGFVELSPDNLPGIGNIDEFLFSLLLIYCLQKLGLNLLPFLRPQAGGVRR